MQKARYWWRGVPAQVRKPVILIIGSVFVLAAAATGWLPGPGGVPLFLIGIAILASEFVWAERVRDRLLAILAYALAWIKARKILGTLLVIAGIITTILAGLTYYSLITRY